MDEETEQLLKGLAEGEQSLVRQKLQKEGYEAAKALAMQFRYRTPPEIIHHEQ